MTIGLCMIVRNEEANIERCLRSALPHIDSWTIVDTGSTDRTTVIIEELLGEKEGGLIRSEWRNFGHNRSELMALAKDTADYLLLLDADMVLHMPDPLPELTADCYQGRILGSSLDYTLPLLVRGDKNWRYEGVAHSYLACTPPHYSEEALDGLAVDDFSVVTEEKIRRDLVALSTEHARNPLDARTAFYLAQTYHDLDMHHEAISAYRHRAHLDGWAEETFYAKYMLGVLLCEHVSFNEGCEVLMDAWNFRPSRIEPLRVIANVANSIADRAPYPTDKLFVHRGKYVAQEASTVFVPPPPRVSLAPGPRPKRKSGRTGLSPRAVSAIVVTRGNADLDPTRAPIEDAGITDIVVWDNSKLPFDYKVFGRYAAIPLTKNPVVCWCDDDVIFTNFKDLLAAYEPGVLVANMDADWIRGAGYEEGPALVGAGSLCDADLPERIFDTYLAKHPWDDDLLVECDFAFGTLAPWKRVDLGYKTRSFTDDVDRLYQQPGQTERKWQMIQRCRALLTDTVAA